jgi:hypothetical protein
VASLVAPEEHAVAVVALDQDAAHNDPLVVALVFCGLNGRGRGKRKPQLSPRLLSFRGERTSLGHFLGR